jgi:hypothetical protein
VGPAAVMTAVEQRPLRTPPCFRLAPRGDPTPNGRPMLTEVAMAPLDARRLHLPAGLGQPLPHHVTRAEHDPVLPADETPATRLFHHLRLEHRRVRPPAPPAAPRVAPWPGGDRPRPSSGSGA